MKIIFDEAFEKSLDKIKDKIVKKQVEKAIFQVEASPAIGFVRNTKKMKGFKTCFRIRVGNYRIGLELEEIDTVRFLIIAHRKDIYKIFP
ncbi:type II toxin-antitoxin system RelE/ParE family toxin [uncultured Mucilaginibacter sp.]|uniref:type II toxin-antitoxin system RelE family toxin n=1 Tax=uncultured Mucilaginibacter sp. TaxID=797541 RepID=UPI00262E4818|nr:type II toxin-antitoxin system RelE/ParE family toxin [uncultured Mucilaginibacter sp.]